MNTILGSYLSTLLSRLLYFWLNLHNLTSKLRLSFLNLLITSSYFSNLCLTETNSLPIYRISYFCLNSLLKKQERRLRLGYWHYAENQSSWVSGIEVVCNHLVYGVLDSWLEVVVCNHFVHDVVDYVTSWLPCMRWCLSQSLKNNNEVNNICKELSEFRWA